MFKSCQPQKTALAFITMGASLLLFFALQTAGPAAQLPAGVILHVTGYVTQPLALSLQDLAAMPRTKLIGYRKAHPQWHGIAPCGKALGQSAEYLGLATYSL